MPSTEPPTGMGEPGVPSTPDCSRNRKPRALKFQWVSLTVRTVALFVLGHPQWPVLRLHVERVVAPVNAATAGSYTEVEIP